MRSSVKRKPTFWDALVAAAVLLLALAAFLLFYGGRSGGELTAVITVDGAEYGRYVLSSIDGELDVSPDGLAYPLTLSLTPEGVWVAQSDCPTQDCVHTGKITRSGESIVCLPNRLTVSLTGGSGGIDAAIG